MLELLVIVTLVLNVNALALPHDPSPEVKIVSGRSAEIEEYPYQVAILENSLLWCGGSIISEKAVLTAAHCVLYATSPLTVHAGSAFWDKPGSVHQVVYNDTLGPVQSADIAILHVAEPFVFDRTRKAIVLFGEDDSAPTGACAHVAGWGLTGESGTVLAQLAVVDVPLVDHDTCNKNYAGTTDKVGPGQLCAGEGIRGPCRGDSGGALVLNNKQLGIVSMGKGCARLEYPTIYTNVSFFRTWIAQHLSS